MKMRFMVVAGFGLLLCSSAHCQASEQKVATPKNPLAGCGTVDQSSSTPICLPISSEDEVSAAKAFTQEFGGDLVFRLNAEQASGGWFIEVVPRGAGVDSQQEYVWVVTPPYHFGNQRYLDTSYGVPAREAIQNSPREFNFALDEEQYKEASRLVDLAISSHPDSDKRSQEELEQERQDATEALLKLPVAAGRLWILDSGVKDPAGDRDFGSIEWLKFRVELRVPCGFPVAAGTRRLSVDSSKCDEIEGVKGN